MAKKKRRKTVLSSPEPNREDLPKSEYLHSEDDRTLLRTTSRRKIGTYCLIAFLVIICLLPFSGKAFNTDDPVYVWIADQIRIHPGDFYGFQINWYDTELPVYRVQKNPPLVSFLIAVFQESMGQQERPLHLAFMIIAVATALGMYTLAIRFCSRPLLAAGISVLTPAFLVSASSVMSDTTMLCFWVWAAVFWIKGMETDRQMYFLFSSLFIGLGSLSKYFGISLVPLLLVHSCASDRTFKIRNLYLLIPVGILILYGWDMQRQYGYNHFLEVFSYAQETQTVVGSNYFSNMFIGTAFVGGGFLTALFFWPYTWRRKMYVWVVPAVILFILFCFFPIVDHISLKKDTGRNYLLIVQMAAFVTIGLSIITLAVVDFARQRDPPSLFLSLWIIGTFVFVIFFNWTIGIRTILPMAPVVGILIARRSETSPELRRRDGHWLALSLLLSTTAALSILWADYRWAETSKNAAQQISSKYLNDKKRLWFQGHWGFQYYMEKSGGRPIDFNRPELASGDIIVIPSPYQNTNIAPFPEDIAKPVETMQFKTCPWISVMNGTAGAGFYSSIWGPVPFVFGPAPQETYDIAVFKNH